MLAVPGNTADPSQLCCRLCAHTVSLSVLEGSAQSTASTPLACKRGSYRGPRGPSKHMLYVDMAPAKLFVPMPQLQVVPLHIAPHAHHRVVACVCPTG
jgi:hypothetical protein